MQMVSISLLIALHISLYTPRWHFSNDIFHVSEEEKAKDEEEKEDEEEEKEEEGLPWHIELAASSSCELGIRA